MELVLSLKPGALRKTFCENPGCFLHCYFYPKNRETPAGDYRIEPHTDKGFITLLWQDKIGGLRAKVNDSWVDLPYKKDHFVVNLGDMLEYITSGVVKGKEPEMALRWIFLSRSLMIRAISWFQITRWGLGTAIIPFILSLYLGNTYKKFSIISKGQIWRGIRLRAIRIIPEARILFGFNQVILHFASKS